MNDLAFDYLQGMMQRHREFLRREREKLREAETEMQRLHNLCTSYMNDVKFTILDAPNADS